MIGYLEPHDRPETAALAEGLEQVPRLRTRARRARARGDGRRRRDPPRAGAGARRRARAHERCPRRGTGSATRTSTRSSTPAIDVTSTVNVQHLESLNDAVFELTGVRVRETFPDRILDEADEVVLVDLTPEALQERLRRRQGLPGRPRRDGARRTSSGSTTWRRCASSSLRELAEDVEARRHDDRARPAQPAGGRRADPRARHAGAALAAHPAPRVPLGAAARLGDRRALGAPAGPGADARRRRSRSPRCAGSRASSARTSSSCEGDNLAGGRQAVRRASAARPTSSSARPTSRAGPRSCAARSSRSSCASCPGSTSASSPTARCARRSAR